MKDMVSSPEKFAFNVHLSTHQNSEKQQPSVAFSKCRECGCHCYRPSCWGTHWRIHDLVSPVMGPVKNNGNSGEGSVGHIQAEPWQWRGIWIWNHYKVEGRAGETRARGAHGWEGVSPGQSTRLAGKMKNMGREAEWNSRRPHVMIRSL